MMNLPDGRTGEWAVWRACQEFNLKPWEDWDSLPADVQASLIAFSQIREVERDKKMATMMGNMLKASMPRARK